MGEKPTPTIPEITPRPDHVPPELVVDFDFRNPPGMDEGLDVYEAWRRLYAGPRIFWTPRHGGHWVLTRAADVKDVQNDYELFSHKEFQIPRGGRPIRLVPLEVDPPEHGPYRMAINPIFTPKAVEKLRSSAREIAVETIEQLKPQGRCDFVQDFARVMPTTVFLKMMDLPLEQRPMFLSWVHESMAAATIPAKRATFARIAGFLKEVVAERDRNRGDDIISHVLNIRDRGRQLQHPDDVPGMVVLLFLGGLDTVASQLAFIARWLARHPEGRRRLIAEPEIRSRAAEEFLRRHGLSNTARTVTRDAEFKGVFFKEDDAVMVPIAMSSMDDERWPHAMQVDFDRGLDKHQHDTFGNGPHRCPGALLARAEIEIFLEEWLTRIPDFEIDPAIGDKTVSAPVNSVARLPLVWPA